MSVLTSDDSCSVIKSIAVNGLYLSRSSNPEGILITASTEVFEVENIIPVKLEHPNHFGFLQFNYKGPGFYDVFSISSIKVSELLLKKSNTRGHEVCLKNTLNDITRGDWNIIHIDTKNESDCHYLFEKAIENNYSVILAMKLMIVDANRLSRQFVLYLDKLDGPLLHRATREKDMKIIDIYLNFNLDINAKDKEGWTALHHAVDSGETDIIDFLISNGADVDARNTQNQVPLHIAVENDNLKILDTLLNYQPKLDAEDCDGLTPLHYAVDAGNIEFVNILLKKRDDCNLENISGCTLLHLVVKRNNLDMIKAFINYNLDINAKDREGWTALYYAVDSRKKHIVDLLISNGADVNATNIQDRVPLHYAVEKDNLRIVDILLKNQANLDKQDTEGQTPLHLAVAAENLDAVDILLKKGANYKLEDQWYRTPLHLAAERLHLEMVEVFLDNNVDPNIVNSRKQTPLHAIDDLTHVKTYGHKRCTDYRELGIPNNAVIRLSIIKILLKKGADINFRDKSGNTPCDHALKNGDITLADFFKQCKLVIDLTAIKRKAQLEGKPFLHVALETLDVEIKIIEFIATKETRDIDAKDKCGRTALHIATNRHVDSFMKHVVLLLRQNASINAVDCDMCTPLHHACRNKNVNVVEYLIEKGADPMMRDEDGKTVLHYACMMDWRYSPSSTDKRKALLSKIISILVKKGVSVNWDDKSGKTPLHYVSEENDDTSSHLCQLLLQNGADINIEDNDGDTAFDKLLYQHSLSEYKKVAPFIHHVIKMKFMEKWVLKKTLDKIYKAKNETFVERVKNYEDNCNKEINAMKETNIDQSDITFYDFLKTSPDDAANYAQNQNIVEAIESKKLKKRFSIYDDFLKCHLREIQRCCNSSDQAQESSNTLKKKKRKL